MMMNFLLTLFRVGPAPIEVYVPPDWGKLSIQERLRCYANQLSQRRHGSRRLTDTLREAADELDLVHGKFESIFIPPFGPIFEKDV